MKKCEPVSGRGEKGNDAVGGRGKVEFVKRVENVQQGEGYGGLLFGGGCFRKGK